LRLSAAFCGFALPTVAAAQEAPAEQVGLTEIIVTAQKREQSVQDVPIAVTAVTQETLQANRITTVNDLGSIAPGVTVRPSAGGIQVPSFTIRGQNSFGVVAGSDKQVSIYLDGVYISSPRGSIFDLPDIQRLEVLRGPQGTLFGRNATAGAVSVVTRDPTGEAHVRAEAGLANQDAYRYRLSADLPQIGPFSAYFSFMRNYRRGDIRNAGAGTVWDRTRSPDKHFARVRRSPDYLGTIDANSYFAAVRFEPSDSFRMVYKFDYNEDNGTPDGNAFIGYNPAFPALGPSAPLVAPILNALYNSQNIYLNPRNQAPDVVNNAFTIPREQRVMGHSLTATWQATDSITVKNIAAYRYARVFAPVPIDGLSSLTFTPQALVPFATLSAVSFLNTTIPGFATLPSSVQGAAIAAAVPGFAGALAPSVGGRVIITASQAASISKQWSDEIQVNYTSERLQVTAGALWFRSRDVAAGPEGMQNTISLTLPPFPASGVIPLGNEGRYSNGATSLAAYAQVEWKFTDQLELVLGSRVTHDKKTSAFRWDSLLSNGMILARPDIVPPTYKKTRPDFLAALNWRPGESTLVYGKFSTSFVSGGSLAGIEFVPETARSFEAGLKADFFDRRLRTNLAVFYVDYKNYQQPSSTTAPEAVAFLNAAYGNIGTTLASNLSTFVQQAHDVRAKGFELEVTAAPIRGLVTGGSLSYTDSEFRNISPAFLVAQGGQYSAFSRPKWTASAYATYETEPLFAESTLQLRVDGLYRSKLEFAGNPERQLALGVPEYQLFSPGHWKLNGRAALRHLQFGGVQAELAVWGRNLTDKRYATSTLYLPFGQASTYDQGRSYGAELTVEF
jgi:iron complex outermembrane receptor protein